MRFLACIVIVLAVGLGGVVIATSTPWYIGAPVALGALVIVAGIIDWEMEQEHRRG